MSDDRLNVPRSLEDTLADAAEEIAILERNGCIAEARAKAALLADVRAAAEDYLVFLSETEAMLRSGRSQKWLRAHFREWAAQGHARLHAGNRQYRMLMIPQRANPQAAYLAGREAGRGAA